MKILIIGSKGFIGSHCVSHFAMEYEVWECDVVTDYNNERYFLIDATTANFEDVFTSQVFDVCINCSGAASVPDSIKNPQRDFMLNVTNVFKQLDAIRKHQPACKYINLSSAAVYGNPIYLPIDEEHPLVPISPYGNHKKMAEEVCEEFYKNYEIGTCSLRVFSAYGPGLKKQLFWDLYRKHQEDKEVNLFGTGKESRDFIFISDLIQAINCVVEKGTYKGTVVNVANGVERTINGVATTFFSLLENENKIVFAGHNREGDPINWVADIKLLQSMGYSQITDINSGLSKYILWRSEQE